MVTFGHEVVQQKSMPQMSHRPGPAAVPHAYGLLASHTAVCGCIETLLAFSQLSRA